MPFKQVVKMTVKRKTKYFITFLAISIGIFHILFPGLKIDAIIITLVLIGILPWLEPLFKSVELPGGLKVEFQDLKKIEREAKEAGLIPKIVEPDIQEENQAKILILFHSLKYQRKIRNSH